MTEKKHWITSLPKVIGLCAGIILTAVGSVMLLNSVLKLYVLQFDTPRYGEDFKMSCQYEPLPKLNRRDANPELEDSVLRTEESLAACVTEKKQNAKEQYQRDKKEDMVSGISSLFVGIFFWVWFGRRRKNDELE